MRTLKFRAWDKEEKVMIDADAWYFGEEAMPFADAAKWAQDAYDLMQFTGLHDCHGKEIYEGDIVNVGGHTFIYFVKWENQDARFNLWNHSLQDWSGGFPRRHMLIVGNIHEHSHLLDNENKELLEAQGGD